MSPVYFNQNGVLVLAGSVRKKYEVGDVIKLKRVFYPLRVVEISLEDEIYCELIKE